MFRKSDKRNPSKAEAHHDYLEQGEALTQPAEGKDATDERGHVVDDLEDCQWYQVYSLTRHNESNCAGYAPDRQGFNLIALNRAKRAIFVDHQDKAR